MIPRLIWRAMLERYEQPPLDDAIKVELTEFVERRTRELGDDLEPHRADLAASYQEAVVRPLAERLIAAAREHGVPAVALGGGVAANGRLRDMVAEGAERAGLAVAVPDRSLCTDNAAMIAAAGAWRLERGERSGWDLEPRDALPLPGLSVSLPAESTA